MKILGGVQSHSMDFFFFLWGRAQQHIVVTYSLLSSWPVYCVGEQSNSEGDSVEASWFWPLKSTRCSLLPWGGLGIPCKNSFAPAKQNCVHSIYKTGSVVTRDGKQG